MKRMIAYGIICFTAVLMLIPACLIGQDVTKVEGKWEGLLSAGGKQLRIVFRVVIEEDGGYKAYMDSPDQLATGIKVDEVIVDGNKVTFKVNIAKAEYVGTFSDKPDEIEGDWYQSGMSFPLKLTRSGKAEQRKRPQTPKKPYPYLEEEVKYENETANIELAGTLTYPDKNKKHPAVILITGSGAQDRDETIMEHKPFLVIADYLTRKGYAVLRVDDRGVGKSGGSFKNVTTMDFATDVESGIQFLKNHKNIDPDRIGLIGHSEGAIISAIVAARNKDVKFIVMLGGPGLPGDELLYLQAAALNKAAGLTEAQIQANTDMQKKIFTIMKEVKDGKEADRQLKAMSIPEAERKRVLSDWFRFFVKYDPRDALQKVTCPVLAMIGTKDLQVPYKENIPELTKALKEAGNKNFFVMRMDGLNHLFQTAETGSVNEYEKIEETFSPKALDEIAKFLKKYAKK